MFKERKSAIIAIACFAFVAFALPLIFFGHEMGIVFKDGLFKGVYIFLALAGVVASFYTIAKAEDPAVSNAVKSVPIIALTALAAWSFFWCSDYRSRASEGIKGETEQVK